MNDLYLNVGIDMVLALYRFETLHDVKLSQEQSLMYFHGYLDGYERATILYLKDTK